MFGKVQLLKVTWLCEHYIASVVAVAADFVVVSFFWLLLSLWWCFGPPHIQNVHTHTQTPLSIVRFVRCVQVFSLFASHKQKHTIALKSQNS